MTHLAYWCEEISQRGSQWVNLSLKVWFEVVKHFQLQREVKLLKYDPDLCRWTIDIDNGYMLVSPLARL